MKIIVDEINPQDCPFYIGQDWNNHGLPIEYYEGYCRLSAEPWGAILQHDECYEENGLGCPFCITYDKFKKKSGLTPNKNKEEK